MTPWLLSASCSKLKWPWWIMYSQCHSTATLDVLNISSVIYLAWENELVLSNWYYYNIWCILLEGYLNIWEKSVICCMSPSNIECVLPISLLFKSADCVTICGTTTTYDYITGRLFKWLRKICYLLYVTFKYRALIAHFIAIQVCSLCHHLTTATETALVYQSLPVDKSAD